MRQLLFLLGSVLLAACANAPACATGQTTVVAERVNGEFTSRLEVTGNAPQVSKLPPMVHDVRWHDGPATVEVWVSGDESPYHLQDTVRGTPYRIVAVTRDDGGAIVDFALVD